MNEAVNRNLARHVDEYRANIGASRVLEQKQLAERSERVQRCTDRLLEFLWKLEADGMTPKQIRAAYRAIRRLSLNMLPLTHIHVQLGADEWRIPVYDDGGT